MNSKCLIFNTRYHELLVGRNILCHWYNQGCYVLANKYEISGKYTTLGRCVFIIWECRILQKNDVTNFRERL